MCVCVFHSCHSTYVVVRGVSALVLRWADWYCQCPILCLKCRHNSSISWRNVWTHGMVWNLLFLTVKESPLPTDIWTKGKRSYMPYDLVTWGEHNPHRTQKHRLPQRAEPALSVEQVRRTRQGNRKTVGCSEDAGFIYHLETQLTASSQRSLFKE